MKQHPLEIQWGDSYWSKGHHDKGEFAEAVHLYTCEKIIISPMDVEHRYWRFVPAWDDQEPGYYWETAPGRGAFPVTVWKAKRQ